MKKEVKDISLKLDKKIYDDLIKLADNEDRSINNLINWILKLGIKYKVVEQENSKLRDYIENM